MVLNWFTQLRPQPPEGAFLLPTLIRLHCEPDPSSPVPTCRRCLWKLGEKQPSKEVARKEQRRKRGRKEGRKKERGRAEGSEKDPGAKGAAGQTAQWVVLGWGRGLAHISLHPQSRPFPEGKQSISLFSMLGERVGGSISWASVLIL